MNCQNCEAKDKELEQLRNWHKQRNSYTDHPANDLNKWEFYDRMPFQISSGTVVILRLFKRIDKFVPDVWIDDHIDVMRNKHGDENNKSIYQRAADQFEKQLEGHHCIAF